MMAPIVNGKSCMVLSTDVPPGAAGTERSTASHPKPVSADMVEIVSDGWGPARILTAGKQVGLYESRWARCLLGNSRGLGQHWLQLGELGDPGERHVGHGCAVLERRSCGDRDPSRDDLAGVVGDV